MNNPESSVYFTSLPINDTILTVAFTQHSTSSSSSKSYSVINSLILLIIASPTATTDESFLSILFIDVNHCLLPSITPVPSGTPVFVGSASNIFSTTSAINSYTCEYFQWVSPTTGNVTLTFQFENDPYTWYMDDVSVSDGNCEMLVNGDFESGSVSPGWTTSTPNGNCVYGDNAAVGTSDCYTGSYCLADGCYGVADQISQSFVAIGGQSYFVSFWLQGASGYGTVSVNVTLC